MPVMLAGMEMVVRARQPLNMRSPTQEAPAEIVLDLDATDVPIHGNHPLKIGLLKSLMKIADLTEPDI